jgi:hypothetical protein
VEVCTGNGADVVARSGTCGVTSGSMGR